jgi:hypothetical protein
VNRASAKSTSLATLLMAAVTVAEPASAAAQAPRGKATAAQKPTGSHVRIATRGGPVHLYRPARYDRRTAGIVVYVHGYYTHVDGAWREHKLGAQFAASRLNALFVVPEAPASGTEASRWTNLRRLLGTVLRRAGLQKPPGPLVLVGHSAAYRTMAPWLVEPSLHHVILIDGMYGNEGDFRAWLDRAPSNQMTLVVKGTGKWADPFVKAIPYAVSVPRIPDSIDDLTDEQRAAKLLHLGSQYGHFELITEGKTLPVLLRRTRVPLIRRATTRR